MINGLLLGLKRPFIKLSETSLISLKTLFSSPKLLKDFI